MRVANSSAGDPKAEAPWEISPSLNDDVRNENILQQTDKITKQGPEPPSHGKYPTKITLEKNQERSCCVSHAHDS